jgi:hypothetical protein
MNILPRQARDKHRESAQKYTVLLGDPYAYLTFGKVSAGGGARSSEL